MQCPNCKEWFHFDDDEIISELEGCTADCPHCEALLIIKNTYCINFHQYMHSQDGRWPVDGKGTGFIEFIV